MLQRLAQAAHVFVFVSIPFAEDKTGRLIEPGAAPIHRRFETLKALSEAGIETGVAVAPIIAGLNDRDVAMPQRTMVSTFLRRRCISRPVP